MFLFWADRSQMKARGTFTCSRQLRWFVSLLIHCSPVCDSMVALGHYTCGQESPGRAWGLGSYSVPVWSRLTERRFEARAHPANMGSFGSQGWRSIAIFNLKSRKRD